MKKMEEDDIINKVVGGIIFLITIKFLSENFIVFFKLSGKFSIFSFFIKTMLGRKTKNKVGINQ